MKTKKHLFNFSFLVLILLSSCVSHQITQETIQGVECNCYVKNKGFGVGTKSSWIGRFKETKLCFATKLDSIEKQYEILEHQVYYGDLEYDTLNTFDSIPNEFKITRKGRYKNKYMNENIYSSREIGKTKIKSISISGRKLPIQKFDFDSTIIFQ